MGFLKDLSPLVNDVFQILLTLLQMRAEQEAKTVKKKVTRWMILWTYYVFSLLLVLVGLIFLGAALFALLVATTSVHVAALVVGAVIFVLGTVMMFVLIANLLK